MMQSDFLLCTKLPSKFVRGEESKNSFSLKSCYLAKVFVNWHLYCVGIFSSFSRTRLGWEEYKRR